MGDRKAAESESVIAGIDCSLRKDRRGAAAFEFALMVPMLMTIALGIVQYGTLYYTYSSMIAAARTAARAVAIGSQNVSTAAATARTNLPTWVPSGNYTIVVTDAAAGSEVSAQITAPSNKATIAPYLPMPANVVARVVMMKEG